MGISLYFLYKGKCYVNRLKHSSGDQTASDAECERASSSNCELTKRLSGTKTSDMVVEVAISGTVNNQHKDNRIRSRRGRCGPEHLPDGFNMEGQPVSFQA
jgi:hypothetical protein